MVDLSICYSEHDVSRCFSEHGGTLLMGCRSWPEPHWRVQEEGLLGLEYCLGGGGVDEIWLWTSWTSFFRETPSRPSWYLIKGRFSFILRQDKSLGLNPEPRGRNLEPGGRNPEAGGSYEKNPKGKKGKSGETSEEGANEKEKESFRKRVFRIPLDKPFEEAYFTHRLWMFFIETRETEEDIRRMFCEAREQIRKRVTLKKKSVIGYGFDPFSCIVYRTMFLVMSKARADLVHASSIRSNKETQLLFSPDPASLECSIRKEARSSSTDNTTCVSLDSAPPPST
ncbi:hypothetical protein F2Q70_00002777 [Brassica cretica]|uniref:Uncharacterized protein n=1 Tax=Brassica cretica TaxID=69181 RepID=A0A8S9J3K9_BRACR|nr:hypothetical protein F2Q70_00002777 [Brassica cretica]